jgi:preprotein translocase subunit Sec61beta
MAFFSLQTPVVDKGVHLKNGATSAGFIKFFENSGNGTNSVTLIGPASTNDVTITLPASADTLVGKATTDTLTNKTISGAALSGTFSGTPTFSGVGTHSALDIFNAGISVKNGSTSAGFIELFEDSGDGSSKTTVIGSALSGDVTLTLPASTDALVGRETTDTLTNKTLSGAALSGTFSGTPTFSGVGTHSALDIFNAGISVKNGSTSAGFIELFEDSSDGSSKTTVIGSALSGDITLTLPASTDTLVGKATTDTLTNKTISGAALSGTFSGTPTFSGAGTHSDLDIFNAGISVKNGSTSAGFIRFYEDDDAEAVDGGYTTLIATAGLSSNNTLTLPTSTGTILISGANTYDLAQTFQAQFILSPLIVTSLDTTLGLGTDINESVSLIYFDLNEASDMYGSIGNGTTGQILHIFFDNLNSGSARIGFGTGKLRSGSGNNDYLTFSQTGQSASLAYITDDTGSSSKWCILNTGAAVS